MNIFDQIPDDMKVIVPAGSLLFRVGNDSNNARDFKYFSYWRGNFIENFNKNKKIFASRCTNTSEHPMAEIWRNTNDLVLIKMSYNSINYDDMNCEDYKQIYAMNVIIDKYIIDDNKKFMYKAALNNVYNYDNSPWEDYLLKNPVTNKNPDYALSQMYLDLNLNGWVRLSNGFKNINDETTDAADEVFLILTAVDKNLKLIYTFTCEYLNKDDFYPSVIMRDFMQPKLRELIERTYTKDQIGGSIREKILNKYHVNKTHFLRLIVNSMS
jgi:hypothetical protein